MASYEWLAEKRERIHQFVFGLDPERFDYYSSMLPVYERFGVRAVRRAVEGFAESKGLKPLSFGSEAIVFADESNGEVVKLFWSARPSRKLEELKSDGETISSALGDIAVPAETSMGRVLGCKFPVQRQRLIAPADNIPENPKDAQPSLHNDLVTLVEQSRLMLATVGKIIDLMPANYGASPDGIRFFDLSLFDPSSRGERHTQTLLGEHNRLEEYIANIAAS